MRRCGIPQTVLDHLALWLFGCLVSSAPAELGPLLQSYASTSASLSWHVLISGPKGEQCVELSNHSLPITTQLDAFLCGDSPIPSALSKKMCPIRRHHAGYRPTFPDEEGSNATELCMCNLDLHTAARKQGHWNLAVLDGGLWSLRSPLQPERGIF